MAKQVEQMINNDGNDLYITGLMEIYANHNIPESIKEDYLYSFQLREMIIPLQGFALLQEKWVNPLAEYLKGKKCVELFCGLGALSKCLQDRGVDIIATDNYEWAESNRIKSIDTLNFWTDIEKIDAIDAVKKYKDADYFIISWCPYKSEASYEVLKLMREIAPNAKLIHIGEDYGGCTDSDKFFEALTREDYIRDEKFSIIQKNFDHFYGLHDEINLIK